MMSAQKLAERVRTALSGQGALREVKMFAGIGFMLNGNLIAGAWRCLTCDRFPKRPDVHEKSYHDPLAGRMSLP
jgi:hypothetical protein